MIVERNAFVVFETDNTTKLKSGDFTQANLVFYVFKNGNTVLVNNRNNSHLIPKVCRYCDCDCGNYHPRRIVVATLLTLNRLQISDKQQFDLIISPDNFGRLYIIKNRMGNLGMLVDAQTIICNKEVCNYCISATYNLNINYCYTPQK